MKIGINGCTGRMGRAIAKEILAKDDLILSAVNTRVGNYYVGNDYGQLIEHKGLNLKIISNVNEICINSDAIIDFSSPESTLELAHHLAKQNKIHVIGTSGFSESQKAELIRLSKVYTIVFSQNMSVGVNLILGLISKAASILDENFDAEIIEIHHRHKKDAPSGTSLMIGEAIAKARGINLKDSAIYERSGMIGERPLGKIGFANIRGGEVIGDHTAIFAGDGERIEISHKAINRNIFAKGAITAACWAKNKPYGFYSMLDVLGLGENTIL